MTASNFQSPPWHDNTKGGERHIGIELEMSGIELDALADLVAEFLSLTVEEKGRYERTLTQSFYFICDLNAPFLGL